MYCPKCNIGNYNKERYCKSCEFPLYCWSGNLNLREIGGIVSVSHRSTRSINVRPVQSPRQSKPSQSSQSIEPRVEYQISQRSDCERLLFVLSERVLDIENYLKFDDPRTLEKEVDMYRVSLDKIMLAYYGVIKSNSELSELRDLLLEWMRDLTQRIKSRKSGENQRQNIFRLKLGELDSNTQYLEQVVSYADASIIEPLAVDCKNIAEQLKKEILLSPNLAKRADLSFISKARTRLLLIDEQIRRRQTQEEADKRERWKKILGFIRDYVLPIVRDVWELKK